MPTERSQIATPQRLRDAAIHLAASDASLAELIADVGPLTLRPPSESHFAALARSIVFQQLAGAAASAIHRRFLGLFAGIPTPEELLAITDTELRGVGLSANKAASIRDLAHKVQDGVVLLDRRSIALADDASIVEHLSMVRGIGPWTAQMFLIFQLRRLDVWPTGDLGVRRGFALMWRRPMPDVKALSALGDPFRPYRSVVALYCWRACEIYGRDADRLAALALGGSSP
jgi:DNA-3-methyladenine glycosylase II